MAGADIPETLRAAVRERAKARCEYCLTTEALSGIRCQADHILPRTLSGMATLENLCLACIACNAHKHARTHAVDSETSTEVSLFNPRQQQWHEHFSWSADRTEIIGKTTTGRATIAALKMNDPLIVGARSLWVGMGMHPPQDE